MSHIIWFSYTFFKKKYYYVLFISFWHHKILIDFVVQMPHDSFKWYSNWALVFWTYFFPNTKRVLEI